MTAHPRILIVGSRRESLDLLDGYLADDYGIRCALSGREALALAVESPPDLILLDATMPEMGGAEVSQALGRNPRTAAVPVIFLTARKSAKSESLALAAGGVDFIPMPTNRDAVRARVRAQLELRRQARELQQIKAELEQRLEKRNQALRDAFARADAAYRAKSEFLGKVNHELRTPMHAILGYSELLARRATDPGVREKLEAIRNAGKQLLGFISDLIDMADLLAGKVEIEASTFGLRELIAETAAPWRERAEAKGLTFVETIDPVLPKRVHGDAARLSQILGHLLGNAVKFSETGVVSIRAMRGHETNDAVDVRFEVEDQGFGIEPEKQKSIFGLFEQADNSSTRPYGGAGLGLAMCRQLVDLLGGEMGLTSAPGKGSLFWVRLSLKTNSQNWP